MIGIRLHVSAVEVIDLWLELSGETWGEARRREALGDRRVVRMQVHALRDLRAGAARLGELGTPPTWENWDRAVRAVAGSRGGTAGGPGARSGSGNGRRTRSSAATSPGGSDESDDPWSPGRLVDAVSGVWEQVFPEPLLLRGQVAKVGRSRAGHRFVTLVDEDAPTSSLGFGQPRVEVVLFANAVRRVERSLRGDRFDHLVRQGALVEVRGSLGPAPGTGGPQVLGRWLTPAGLVDVRGERDRMAAVMADERWVERRPPLPSLVTRVAALVSTAGDGDLEAALRLADAPFAPAFLRSGDLNPQSEVARQQVPHFLRRARAAGVDVAAILFGGHLPEVSEWDAEPILRAIHEAHLAGLPVVAGFAHGQDQPLVKRLAHDLAQASAAVTRLAHHNDALLGRAGPLLAAASRAVDGRLRAQHRDVRRRLAAGVAAVPAAVTGLDARARARPVAGGAALEAATSRLEGRAASARTTVAAAAAATADRLDHRAATVGHVGALFDTLAVVTDADGRPLGPGVAPGDRLHVRHRHGRLTATVTRVEHDADPTDEEPPA